MKDFVTKILVRCAKRYIKESKGKVIVVAGSVGKTSTTQAIAHILSARYKVVKTRKNYNVAQTVPLSIYGLDFASNALAWVFLVLRIMYRTYLCNIPIVDFFVLEIGTDKPGDIEQFAWLKPEMSVLTAISHEHMQNFASIDDVAAEELELSRFSKKLLINGDMLAKNEYLNKIPHELYTKDIGLLKLCHPKLIGDHSMTILSAAITVGLKFWMQNDQIIAAVNQFEPVPGRMQKLEGVRGITIIDDTYNSSPVAVEMALNCLYNLPISPKIAVLGQMNELGEHSEHLHIKIAEYLDPTKLDLLITLHGDMNRFAAEKAKEKGIKVIQTDNYIQAATALKDNIVDNCVVLVKGSQNGVFAEEVIKPFLKDPLDQDKLVRQSKYWLKIKATMIK